MLQLLLTMVAIGWDQIEFNQRVYLSQQIVFENGLEVSPQDFALVDRYPLAAPGVAVVYHLFRAARCEHPKQTAALSLNQGVGLEWLEDCYLVAYVEAKDLSNTGFWQVREGSSFIRVVSSVSLTFGR